MATETTIDFSNYSNRDLDMSLSSIDRDKFEHNYQAGLAEMKKRKADGTWPALILLNIARRQKISERD